MNDSNDFRELWQSQPIVQGPAAKVPRFGLLEDLTVPVFAPLAPWRRVSYALWAVSPIHFNWQTNLAPEWLHKAPGWTALVLGLACLCLILVVRDRTQEPQPEENLQSYGKALVNEFERQFSLERWILILLCVDSIAVSILWSTAEVLGRRTSEVAAMRGPLLVIAFVIVGARAYRRAANAVRSRLTSESETEH